MTTAPSIIVIALAMSAPGASAVAQDAAVSSDAPSTASAFTSDAELETIEVVARREALRKEVQSFVADLTRSDGEFVGRWNRPVCLWMSGLPAGHAAFMRARIAALASSAGVPFDPADDCQANLFVFVTAEPDELLAQLRKRNPRLLGVGSPSAQQLFLSSQQAVRAWYDSRLLNADGTSPIEEFNKPPQFRLENSKIVGGVAENMASVMIIVDSTKMAAVSIGQLADYLCMVGFAQIEPRTNVAGRRTILSLFETANSRHAPAQLTDWDMAFLKALYATEQANKDHRGLIATSMVRELEIQAGR
jgi:hypothetical protein